MCERQRPIVHGLESEYGNRVRFEYTDIAAPEARRYNVSAHPTSVLVDSNGNLIRTMPGVTSREMFEAAIKDVLK